MYKTCADLLADCKPYCPLNTAYSISQSRETIKKKKHQKKKKKKKKKTPIGLFAMRLCEAVLAMSGIIPVQ